MHTYELRRAQNVHVEDMESGAFFSFFIFMPGCILRLLFAYTCQISEFLSL